MVGEDEPADETCNRREMGEVFIHHIGKFLQDLLLIEGLILQTFHPYPVILSGFRGCNQSRNQFAGEPFVSERVLPFGRCCQHFLKGMIRFPPVMQQRSHGSQCLDGW